MDLEQAVIGFARQAYRLSDADLEKPWAWRDYDEGVRHAFFRTYEQLNELAAVLETKRQASRSPLTTAWRLLGIYHAGFRDLEAILFGVDDGQAVQHPGEGEWSVVQVLGHMIQAERSFFAITRYALERVRAQEELPLEMSDEAFASFWEGDAFPQLRETGSCSELLLYYRDLHRRILSDLGGASEAELQAPTVFWESEPYPVQYRLLRFDSHLRQHTIQIEKALQSLAIGLGEWRLLVQHVYAALAAVEGASLGTGGSGVEPFELQARQDLADEIVRRTGEVAAALAA